MRRAATLPSRGGPLPVDAVVPELLTALRSSPNVVLEAPPGAGKTTRIPLALLGESWAKRKIVMLEPRRLAARAAARRMAWMLREPVGRTVGYRMRLDTRVSADTRVEVVTEGVLTRMLQDDPSLDGIGVLIFDEFHERNLQADVGLALALESRRLFGQDLRILVMSATLDGDSVSTLLGGAPVVRAEGKMYPVRTVFDDSAKGRRIEDAVTSGVRRALDECPEGDVLAFLPGGGEIRRTAERLDGLALPVHMLYGDLAPEAQDAALAPTRRVGAR